MRAFIILLATIIIALTANARIIGQGLVIYTSNLLCVDSIKEMIPKLTDLSNALSVYEGKKCVPKKQKRKDDYSSMPVFKGISVQGAKVVDTYGSFLLAFKKAKFECRKITVEESFDSAKTQIDPNFADEFVIAAGGALKTLISKRPQIGGDGIMFEFAKFVINDIKEPFKIFKNYLVYGAPEAEGYINFRADRLTNLIKTVQSEFGFAPDTRNDDATIRKYDRLSTIYQ